MVFTRLSPQEKDAFFGLLDEYFQSRPELLQGREHQGAGISTAAAASVVQRALTANATGGRSNNPYAASMASTINETDVARAMSVGRVAAASLAFSGGGHPLQSSPSPSPTPSQVNPPTLPRRAMAGLSVPVPASSDRVGSPGGEVDKLVSRKTSVFSAFKKPEHPGVPIKPIPPAFTTPKNAFVPPPVRRVPSETGPTGGGGIGTRAVPRQPEPEPQPEVAEGEWAEVLYDYTSEDPGDLAIETGSRVFVTDKTSDDWWTGQVEGQGKEGLFPASYVKLL